MKPYDIPQLEIQKTYTEVLAQPASVSMPSVNEYFPGNW